MEEMLKAGSRVLILICATLGAVAGSLGALCGVTWGRFLVVNPVPEKLLVDALLGGLIVGVGIGYGVAKMRPRREEWFGFRAGAVLSATSMLVSATSCGFAFHGIRQVFYT